MNGDLCAARLVMPAVRWKAEGGFEHEREMAARAVELGVGGFIVFGGTVSAIRRFVGSVLQQAGRPLLIGSDLERGAGQQVAGLSEFPPPAALASLEDPGAIVAAAGSTAAEARYAGINWVFAPVADLDCEPRNPIVQTRAFGADPDLVARDVTLWVEACQAAGALASAKHYPGHGRTTGDSHRELPRVDAPLDVVERDELPFRAAVSAGVASVMTAHVGFPALDPLGAPATFSAPILSRLRRKLGFSGLVVTDAMIMEAARSGAGEAQAAVAIVNAGCDMLLYPQQPIAVAEALLASAASGELPEPRLREALARYDRALAQATGTPSPLERSPEAVTTSLAIADRLIARGMARGEPPRLKAPLDLFVVDDDQGGPYPAVPDVIIPRDLHVAGVPEGKGGSTIVLAYAEPRGWKGRAGFSLDARQALALEAPVADLVVLFGHPRLLEEIPGNAPVLVAWHRQNLMQFSVARWIQKHLVI
ncbi:MAG TPA: glycoside hydrolase family 3 N-terminal domain-containing protein [Gemmatimonadales bacterium]|nr:glycoside hydrolase family 3 N-terminal domain-containing protein [Gemmatimonadales bacterium]